MILAGIPDDTEETLKRERAHMSEAVLALRNILEAQPRLSALMASQPALAPILNCIEPICRSAQAPRILPHNSAASYHPFFISHLDNLYMQKDTFYARLMMYLLLGRRLHQLEVEGLGGEHAAAAAAARASPKAASQADVAAQALAVLVRLTAHSGAFD